MTRRQRRPARGPAPPALPPALALVPLRLFLGVTFLYAGIQKLSDPGYLHPGAATYIGSQLHQFATGTPGGFLLRAFALPAPKLTGVVTALVEIAVGLLVTIGLGTRAAATVGMLLNLVLFLTNSWKTYPYFLGSDIVFVFAWLPFVLTGAAGQPALDNELERFAGPRRGAAAGPALSRREVMVRAFGLTAGATLFLGGVASLLKGSYRSGARTLGAGPSSSSASSSSGSGSGSGSGSASSSSSGAPQGAVKLGPSSRLPRGQAATYTDPSDGQPDIVIRQSDGSLTAFSAVCTHQGCTVGFQSGEIVCPCHGGTFNAHTGAVEGGPPPSGLSPRKVSEQGGYVYAIPS